MIQPQHEHDLALLHGLLNPTPALTLAFFPLLTCQPGAQQAIHPSEGQG
jgi:hypothetical protein